MLDLLWFVLFACPEVKSSSMYVSSETVNKLNRHHIQQSVSVAAWDLGKMGLILVVSPPPLDGA